MFASLNFSDERSIVGGYKSLSLTDPDAIYSHKQLLIKSLKMMRFMSWFFIIGGLPLLIFIFPGVIFIGIGIFMRVLASKKIKLIEQATDTYCRQIGIEPV